MRAKILATVPVIAALFAVMMASPSEAFLAGFAPTMRRAK